MTPERAAEEALLRALVERAKNGERDALEELISTLQHGIYRLALRMTACPADAEDAAQEILIKIVTRLDSFRGDSSIRTWAYRIVVNHMLDRRKSRVESLSLNFQLFGADLLDGLAAEPDPDPLAAEEVKLGCTLAMLTCLDREHRVAYILADVFDFDHVDAAAFCGVSEEVHRQRVSRARRALEAFTESYCGIVSEAAPCRCSRRVAKAEKLGRVHRDRLALVNHSHEKLVAAKNEMNRLHETARLFRSHPKYLAPDRIVENVRKVLKGTSITQ